MQSPTCVAPHLDNQLLLSSDYVTVTHGDRTWITLTKDVGPGQHSLHIDCDIDPPPVSPYGPPHYQLPVVREDRTTQGNWQGVYGGLGYAIFGPVDNNDIVHLPPQVCSSQIRRWPAGVDFISNPFVVVVTRCPQLPRNALALSNYVHRLILHGRLWMCNTRLRSALPTPTTRGHLSCPRVAEDWAVGWVVASSLTIASMFSCRATPRPC